jgi:hypothetical protein
MPQHYFTYEQAVLLLQYVIAHIIGDFLLQPNVMVRSKKQKMLASTYFWIHGLIITLCTAILSLQQFSVTSIAIIGVSHIIIDYCKLLIENKQYKRWRYKAATLFIGDQFLHIIMIIIAWALAINGGNTIKLLILNTLKNYPFMLYALGYLLMVGPVTYLIKFLTIHWAQEIDFNNDGLAKAGKWIGILERVMVITLVFKEQFTAIGFLVAAKSILRLIDKPERKILKEGEIIFSTRKHTEYVLIGTFLSFGTAVLTGLAINVLLKL